MDNTTAPGVIPEWAPFFQRMSPNERLRAAIAIGVTPRTIDNWATGRTLPTRNHAEAIRKAAKKWGVAK